MKKSAKRDQLNKRLRSMAKSGTTGDLAVSFYAGVADADLADRDAADLLAAAVSFERFARARAGEDMLVRVINPSVARDGWYSSHTVVNVVTTDMPFLVDSVTMALNRRGYTIHSTVHPVFMVDRTPKGKLRQASVPEAGSHEKAFESWQLIEIDRETDGNERAAIEEDLRRVLSDVRAAVRDWKEMRTRAHRIRVELESEIAGTESEEISEIISFMDWMEDNQFTFLGYREYELHGDENRAVLTPKSGTGLGILRDTRSGRSERELPKESLEQVRARGMLIITKANSIATVHRPSYLDYVGVKTFDEHGAVSGERRFLGLFTSLAYSCSPRRIPILRKKVDEVMRRSGLPSDSHSGKALSQVLETHPRDELFQSSVAELLRIATGIVQLQERQRVKLFVRRDAFNRFYSCLVYVPRDRYNTQARNRIESILLDELGGTHTESSVSLDESILARVHIIVRTEGAARGNVKTGEIEARISDAVRSWEDHLYTALLAHHGEEQAAMLHRIYADSFSAAYREDVHPGQAVYDIGLIETLEDEGDIRLNLHLPEHSEIADRPESVGRLRFRIFRPATHIAISDILPILENMGLRVIAERPYEVSLAGAKKVWIQDVDMRQTSGAVHDFERVREHFQDAFAAIWRGEIENDAFNCLVLAAGLNRFQVMVLRGYCRYLLQTGLPFSQRYIARILAENSGLATMLVRSFENRFDPDFDGNREHAMERSLEAIREGLESVPSLDADRVLRAISGAIRATLRTNYFQGVRNLFSFKLDSSRVPELPLPRPVYEIFVYSPRFEAIHLRGGRVARGGLRWSDRQEDFRTEVLGLMKAQQVKNTLIVPVGAKGGFVVKQPLTGNRDEQMEVVRSCYADFLRGMLDITDNLVKGKPVTPERCVRHDEDDPYLVVAADKGTATFSDLANSVAAEYDFWLGDAFASGGSVGYDHKKMGITAKGAWESVQRHFREQGIDARNEDFTAVGIGDMAGDVFGNGMLCSKHTKLIAAFNHMHIFLDPDPDPEKSFAERRRLFSLSRSTWEDYDSALISSGGGVYERSAKSIRLGKRAADALGAEPGDYTPTALISAILKAPVDLLWNGGIGTYVKSREERHREVGDRSNDAVRVNGHDLRCRIVGEGGNLGFTQAGRIEYAQRGGRINTDFIDNSGGVDCSDREVNIKILLTSLRAAGQLSAKRRDKLFLDMTGDVGKQVLRDNYLQAQAISFSQTQGVSRLNEYAQLIRTLERRSGLNRTLEVLPDEEQIGERRKTGQGLTRPEIATLLAHAKNDIYGVLLESDVPSDTYLSRELAAYFPRQLQTHATAMEGHRLRDEIICTAITNSMVNRMGPSFSQRMCDDSGCGHAEVARAFTIVREVFRIREIWSAIEAGDHSIPAGRQMTMLVKISHLTRHATRWILNHRVAPDIREQVERYGRTMGELLGVLESLLPPAERDHFTEAVAELLEESVAEDVARFVAGSDHLYAAFDLAEIAKQGRSVKPITTVAGVYFSLANILPFEWIREQIESLPVDGHWQSVARGTMREDYYRYRSALTGVVLNGVSGKETGETLVGAWAGRNTSELARTGRILREMQSAGPLDFATASVALQEIRKLTQ